MFGAVVGDIIGSHWEFNPTKDYNFPLFWEDSHFTDDTVMTMAVAKWLIDCKSLSADELIKIMQDFGRRYPDRQYGESFAKWIVSPNPKPYNSFGNGAAMRVSPVAYYGQSLETVLELAELTASVSHNHPEGIKGAKAVATAIYLARGGYSKEMIRDIISGFYGYDLNREVNKIKHAYEWDVSCQGSVPESIIAFLDGDNFEDVIRKAVSLGGDSDTMACIAGSIASQIYPIPPHIGDECWERLPKEFQDIILNFQYLVNE